MGELKWEQRYHKTRRVGHAGVTVLSYRIVLYEIVKPVQWYEHVYAWSQKPNCYKAIPLRKNDKRIRIWKVWIVARGSTDGPKSQLGRARIEATELMVSGLFYVRLRLGKPGQIVDYRIRRKGE